jgi:DNA polymerase-1
MKLRLRDPESTMLNNLIRYSEKAKELSSYLQYAYDDDGRMRYTLSVHGTETGRMSCYKDPWNRGLNIQTVPKHLRHQYIASPGMRMIEVDLRQAESRFVAWDAPEPTMIEMYKSGADIHRFVASQPELFNKTLGEISGDERQLGKKVGHAANYGMKEYTLSETCLVEMDLVLPTAKAKRMLAGYHRIFPGVRLWQNKVRNEVLHRKRLRTPLGFERYFYARPSDDQAKEAYAYRPQNVVTQTINHLALHMFGHARLLMQGHDALLMEVPEERMKPALARIYDLAAWNPSYVLPGGVFQIPIEVKVGVNWYELVEVGPAG